MLRDSRSSRKFAHNQECAIAQTKQTPHILVVDSMVDDFYVYLMCRSLIILLQEYGTTDPTYNTTILLTLPIKENAPQKIKLFTTRTITDATDLLF
jgi:hypothetical protein